MRPARRDTILALPLTSVLKSASVRRSARHAGGRSSLSDSTATDVSVEDNIARWPACTGSVARPSCVLTFIEPDSTATSSVEDFSPLTTRRYVCVYPDDGGIRIWPAGVRISQSRAF